MPTPLFYIFAILMLVGGIGVVAMKNPVSSALSMVASFVGLAALLVGLNAYFLGVLQILVYAGAIMVLFIFIIMLLDLKKEEETKPHYPAIAAAVVIPLLFMFQLAGVVGEGKDDFFTLGKEELQTAAKHVTEMKDETSGKPLLSENNTITKELNDGKLPDVNLVGQKLFTKYNFPLQVVGILLLVATVGCVALSKKPSKQQK